MSRYLGHSSNAEWPKYRNFIHSGNREYTKYEYLRRSSFRECPKYAYLGHSAFGECTKFFRRLGRLVGRGTGSSLFEGLMGSDEMSPDHGANITSVLTMASRSSETVRNQVLASVGGAGAVRLEPWITAGTVIHFRSARRPESVV